MAKTIEEQMWNNIVDKEPLLAALREEASAVKDEGGDHFCANTVWYQDFKPTLTQLVGFEASKKSLRSMLAYDIAYQTVYNELPACRNCTCF